MIDMCHPLVSMTWHLFLQADVDVEWVAARSVPLHALLGFSRITTPEGLWSSLAIFAYPTCPIRVS